MKDGRESKTDDPRVPDAGTIAGRATIGAKAADEPGSPGASIDCDQAKERNRDRP